ncbi:transcription termination factor Rho [Mycobacterium sp. 1164985.4]|uniref:transcription termination factor Rho n=1 Tax=Mycobacterium sp. 1164985.4 TaxID=1834069 RepID=UPI0007FDA383|nr:transcription termination factor Rho [Mycobacterium sp. 1164985.4]OBK80613.1 transcription termination factor Rho [Mycobacterium sp. 1164985.4]
MTETDLITAGGSSDSSELSNPVNSDTSTSAAADSPNATPTAETAPTADVASGNRSGSLSTMVLPELRALAKEIGVEGASGMRKGELVAAIRERRGESNGRGQSSAGGEAPATNEAKKAQPAKDASKTESAETGDSDRSSNTDTEQQPRRRERRGASRGTGAPDGSGNQNDNAAQDTKSNERQNDQPNKSDAKSEGDQQQGDQQGGQNRGGGNSGNNSDDDGEGRGGRRGRRFRDRRRRERGGDGGGDRDTELREDDVVQPVAGILDVLDNYAFVRTSGYLAGPNDVYVSMNMVRKNGLRRGDAVTGAVRVPKDGEQTNQRQKFNPLVRLDTVNGKPVDEAKKRPEFNKLTPLYPNQRLRLETTTEKLTTRVIDLIMPIGKGQRALIVSPPKAGKTTILQDIANAITTNNPECHLMVVLVDERPEEVTDMQRSVKGEVIASTFDRPPSDHTQAAELAIERAKRLVEQGKDVVVLLDSITRLGRAYNNASPASGRILSGGVDSTALYPPKRFLGAARNIEEGGSLTIVATAMVETGSTGDTVIFEEFKGTGNAELKLDRKIAERRVFPAVDVNPSGTRKDELLLSPDEFAIVHKLRRVLSGLDPHQAIDLLMSQLRKTKNNYEFLVQVSKTAPGSMDAD